MISPARDLLDSHGGQTGGKGTGFGPFHYFLHITHEGSHEEVNCAACKLTAQHEMYFGLERKTNQLQAEA